MFSAAGDTITLCAVGDVSLGDSPKMLGIGVRSLTTSRGGEYLFANCRDELRADLVFGNLEGVLTDSGYDPDDFHRGQLCGTAGMALVLKNAGFNILNVANNHMMQYGPSVFRETCELLEGIGISVVGLKGEGEWHCLPVILVVRNLRIGFLGYADADNYGYCPKYATNEPEVVLADVRRLRGDVDLVVVSVHWGDEFVRAPSPSCRRYGEQLVEAGADIVLGHHPHVVQGVHAYRSGWICYSLGNFISDMIWNPRTQEGLLARFGLSHTATSLNSIDLVSINDDFAPTSNPFTLDGLACHVAMDEADSLNNEVYHQKVRLLRSENRNLAHLFLARNFFRFRLKIYLKILFNSFCSLIGKNNTSVAGPCRE